MIKGSLEQPRTKRISSSMWYQSKHSKTLRQYFRCFLENIHVKVRQTHAQDARPSARKKDRRY